MINFIRTLINRRKPTELESWWAGIESNLAARKAARESGQVYVSGHFRRAR